jgi:acyl-CoA thioester hydrolase
VKIRVYYEDTDAGGIVYHANYLKYCERARSEIFFEAGMRPFEGERSGFVVRRAECDFLGRARLGDLVEVRTRLLTLKRASVTLLQEIVLDDETIFRAHIHLAYLAGGKPARIPEKFIELFKTIE